MHRHVTTCMWNGMTGGSWSRLFTTCCSLVRSGPIRLCILSRGLGLHCLPDLGIEVSFACHNSSSLVKNVPTTPIAGDVGCIYSREYISLHEGLKCCQISGSRCPVDQRNGLYRNKSTWGTLLPLDLFLCLGCSSAGTSTKQRIHQLRNGSSHCSITEHFSQSIVTLLDPI